MSCNHCGTKFNVFHKELGCANCGLSLCGKCLQQKFKIPSKGQGEFKVCRTCYSKLLNGAEESDPIIVPDRFLKRLENLENPAAPPITVYRQNPKVTALKSGLSSKDQALVDRLEKLKEKQTLPPSDSEIRDRLAKLKGHSFGTSSESETNKPFYTPDTRTEQEKINSLLEQYTSEQEISGSCQAQDALAHRLATLKGEEYKENRIYPDLEELDSEEEIDHITKKIVSEVSLDERCPIGSSKRLTNADDDEDIRSSSPQLPWCVLCNNDATHRCLDCGGDLYCNSCNTEVHKNWGDTDHKVVPYNQK